MNKHLYFGLLMSILMTGCAESKPDAAVEKETLSSCNVKLSNIQFTQAKNGREQCHRIQQHTEVCCRSADRLFPFAGWNCHQQLTCYLYRDRQHEAVHLYSQSGTAVHPDGNILSRRTLCL